MKVALALEGLNSQQLLMNVLYLKVVPSLSEAWNTKEFVGFFLEILTILVKYPRWKLSYEIFEEEISQ